MYIPYNQERPFSDLVGKTLSALERDGDEVIKFKASSGETYVMYHDQDCCESVHIEDVCGDIEDIIGSPILVADEVTGETAKPDGWVPGEYEESYTWTFYKIDTAKGGITIRWFGSSNGYYSERVDFRLMEVQS